ncbi:MAG: hypothetical protein U0R64_02895 [Candidatus Nanopelagicales bacterium]
MSRDTAPARRRVDWAAVAAQMNELRDRTHRDYEVSRSSPRDPEKERKWIGSAQSFRAGLENVWAIVDEAVADLPQPGAVGFLVGFLDAAPRFHRSGYLASDVIRQLTRRPEAIEPHRVTLQAVVLDRSQNSLGQTIRSTTRLATAVWDERLHERLTWTAEHGRSPSARTFATVLLARVANNQRSRTSGTTARGSGREAST